MQVKISIVVDDKVPHRSRPALPLTELLQPLGVLGADSSLGIELELPRHDPRSYLLPGGGGGTMAQLPCLHPR